MEEAVRFLGGKTTNTERREMVAYLLKDKDLFTRAYDELERGRRHGGQQWSNMAFVVVHYLRNELLDMPVPADQTDLKPPGARSLQQVVDAKVEGDTAVPATEDLSKYDGADALWAHLAELRQGAHRAADHAGGIGDLSEQRRGRGNGVFQTIPQRSAPLGGGVDRAANRGTPRAGERPRS